ncbi:unnamed protein product [Hanseniaspora opuntiae]|jgi:hypothetical protein|uniref:Uncharacterized protein n=1 Tax=Hanseniaspora opuntiae TaxID=211096 RepID=A0A1E5RL83_9ASCO|nr:hypothetical protein AWRI3578_g2235 [Hanseniaspora opuntiae]
MASANTEHIDPLLTSNSQTQQNQQTAARTLRNQVYRRSRIQAILTYLIRFTILVIIPIALGNFTRLLIDHFALSNSSSSNEMLHYFQNMNVLVPLTEDLIGDDSNDFQSNYRLIYIGGDRESLIAKYHNILVYFTSKMIKPYVMDKNDTYLKALILSTYSKAIKTLTASLVMTTTLLSTLYLWFALLFFCVCIVFNLSIKLNTFSSIIMACF